MIKERERLMKAALLGETDGPWWIVTIIEKQEER